MTMARTLDEFEAALADLESPAWADEPEYVATVAWLLSDDLIVADLPPMRNDDRRRYLSITAQIAELKTRSRAKAVPA